MMLEKEQEEENGYKSYLTSPARPVRGLEDGSLGQ